ncbi:MAG: histidine phosphatase family protein [Nocardioidaceae bacterium]|nr:histidine phosphatase family protein [Nocardioidaceae bacterium]
MVSSSTASESPAAGPRVWVVRHGETEWSRAHRHTSVTDLPLTEVGEQAAVALRERLVGRPFARVLTSPRLRARRTAELAGFPGAEIDEDLVEWDYGDFEGMSTARIRETVPGWTIWTHASPGGESADAVAARLDRLIARVGAVDGDVLLFSHGHALRALAARWLGQPVSAGAWFLLDTATVSQLGHERDTPVIARWNG